MPVLLVMKMLPQSWRFRRGKDACPTGDEDVAPKLEVQEAPDAIGGIFEAAFVAGEEIFQVSKIDIGGQQALAILKLGDQGIGAGVHQPLAEWRGEAHFLTIDDVAREDV